MKNLPETLPDESEYDPEDRTLTMSVDSDDGDVPQAIVLGVEALSDESVESMNPLAAAVDPDALNALFEHRRNLPAPESWVSFAYHEHRVTVYSGGRIDIEPLECDER